jgi:hypothetical protein
MEGLDGLDARRLLDIGQSQLDPSLNPRENLDMPAAELLEEIEVLFVDGVRGAQALSQTVDLRRGELGHQCHSRKWACDGPYHIGICPPRAPPAGQRITTDARRAPGTR